MYAIITIVINQVREVIKMNVNKQITLIRENKNLSVNKLSQLAGISQTGLREIELGNKQPTISTLEKICTALDISLVDFFTYGTNSDFPSELRNLLESAKDLDRKSVV